MNFYIWFEMLSSKPLQTDSVKLVSWHRNSRQFHGQFIHGYSMKFIKASYERIYFDCLPKGSMCATHDMKTPISIA